MKPWLKKEQQEERRKKFWIVPGCFVSHRLYPGVVMSVREILSKRTKEKVGPCSFCQSGQGGEHGSTPVTTWCEKGTLMKWRNMTSGIRTQWLDSLGRHQQGVFQVKELVEWTDPDGKTAPNNA